MGELESEHLETLGKLLVLVPAVERLMSMVEANLRTVETLSDGVNVLRSELHRQSAVMGTVLERIEALEAKDVSRRHPNSTATGSGQPSPTTYRPSYKAAASLCQQSSVAGDRSAAPVHGKNARSRCGPTNVGTGGDTVPIPVAPLSPPSLSKVSVQPRSYSSEPSQIFISRVAPGTSPESILKYVRYLSPEALSVSQLKTRPEYSSFVITTGARGFQRISDPCCWKVGILVREFRGEAKADQVVAFARHDESAHDFLRATLPGNSPLGDSRVPPTQQEQ